MSAPFYSPIDMQHGIRHTPPGFVAEPVPLSTYREDESEHHNFWENSLNREEPEAKENGKRSVDKSSFAHGETDLNQLPAIPPASTGQGLPYAPVDWPSFGDVWSWRVGKRVTAAGYHHDRCLILPQRLQQKNVPKSFASKSTLLRYFQSNFPGMDADAFFASFSWKVPALFQPSNKVDAAASLFEETPKEVKTEAAPNVKEGNSRYSQRKRTPMPTQTYEPVEAKAKTTPRGSSSSSSNKKKKGATTPATERQSTRRASNQRRGGGDVDLNHLNEEEGEPAITGPNTTIGRRKKRRVNLEEVEEEEDVSIPHIYVSPMNGVLAVSHEPIDVDPIEFDSYLNSLDNLLHQGPGRDSSSVLVSASSPMREYEWAEARMKISSLLEKDFSSLLTSKDAAEIAALAAKLRKDPNLSAEEIVRLKLMGEIPTFSEVFKENKAVIEEADRFFSSLELNKAKVASLKYEYSDLRHKLGSVQMEVDESSEAIRRIDEQIAQLQGRRAELKRCIGSKEKEKVDLSYGQKMVANSIPKVVQEVQGANSKKPEWECKKGNALKREEEILSKFTPLRGFFL